MSSVPLIPAQELARKGQRRFPNENAAYRDARTALLAEEIALRRQIEHVAEQRRALPPGGVVPENYEFHGEQGPITLREMFGSSDTLITYNWMYGPQREKSCPMCTSLLAALDGEMQDILQNVPFAVIASSPIARLVSFKKERGWRNLRLYSSAGNHFNRDYAAETADSGDNAGFNVFRRDGDTIRHFWGDEMGVESADPGQDPRGAPDAMPLWTVLDLTPAGRRKDWYPKLAY